MQTFLIGHEGLPPFAFEIENIYASRRAIARILREIDGVTEVRVRGHFGSQDDIRIAFKYQNSDYQVWEPYGDSSRYWIGPQNPESDSPDIRAIESRFKEYHPPLHRKIFGDVFTLKFLKHSKVPGSN